MKPAGKVSARWAILLVVTLSASFATGDEQTQIDFANGLFSRGFYEDAAEEYRTYLQQYPGGADRDVASYRLGESQFATGQYADALSAFESALGSRVSGEIRERATLRKGVTLYHLNRLSDARAILDTLVQGGTAEANRGEALYYLGKLHFEASNHDAATKSFTRLIRELPGHALAPFAQYQLAFVYVAQGALEKAAIQFSEVANAASANESLRVECRFRAAETYDKIGWFDAAVKAYGQLQEDFPESDYANRAAYGHAWALYHAGHYPEAITAANTFLSKHPDSSRRAAIAYLKGNCYQQQKKYEAAVTAYRQLRAAHAGTEFARRAHYKLAWTLDLMGDPAAALRELDVFLKEEDTLGLIGDAAFLRGTIVVAQGNYEDAYQEFRLVATRYPKSEFAPEALYKSAECLALLGRHAEAAPLFDQFARAHPKNPLAFEATLRSGDGDFMVGNFATAIEKYGSVVRHAPGGTIEEEATYRMAVALHNVGNYRASADAFSKIIGTFPKSRYLGEANLRVGDVYLRDAGDAVRSMKYYRAAFASNPKGPFAGLAQQGLALARFESKDYAGAADSFLRLIREYPAIQLNEETYAWAGQYFFDHDNWAAATTVFQALLQNVLAYPNPERVLFKIAESHEMAGRVDEALAGYLRVAETAPRSKMGSKAKYRSAGLHESRGETEIALALYEEAANTNSGESAAQAQFRLGEIYEERGEFRVAARHFMRVAILFLHETLSPEALWRAGQSFEKDGDDDQARKTYEEVLNEFPDSEQASQAKQRIASL